MLWTPLAGFTVRIRDQHDVTHHTTVGPSETPFLLDTWVHVRVTWDTEPTDQLARVYFDGNEPTYTSSPFGPIDMPVSVLGSRMYIGAWSNVLPLIEPAMGLIDEFAIYDEVVLP